MTTTVLPGCDCVVTIVPVGVFCVVWVVTIVGVEVVVTSEVWVVGGAGGGAVTRCDSGSEEQPANSASAPQKKNA